MEYRVYYMRPQCFSQFIFGDKKPEINCRDKTHTYVRNVSATSLEDVFTQCQAERWSPNGEARPLILDLGLGHTSMSIGDVIEDPDQNLWAVSLIGFTKL